MRSWMSGDRTSRTSAPLSFAMIGFGDRLVDVQRQFVVRHRLLKDRYGGRTPEDLFEMDDDERESLWRVERATYNQLLSVRR